MPAGRPGVPGSWCSLEPRQRGSGDGEGCPNTGPPGPRDGNGRPRQGAPIPSSQQNLDIEQDTPTLRQARDRRAEPVHVWAHGYLVVGTRGLCRLVLVVARCPWCHRPHAHNGKPTFGTGKRRASCHGGRYVVHLGTVEGEVAA